MDNTSARLAAGIGNHAANEALRIIMEVIERIPESDDTARVAAAAVAAGVLKARLDITLSGVEDPVWVQAATDVYNCTIEQTGPIIMEKVRAKRAEFEKRT